MSDNPFGDLLNDLSQDPQFVAQAVMQESLSGLFPQMSDEQVMATHKLIAQFARALDEAEVLRAPEDK